MNLNVITSTATIRVTAPDEHTVRVTGLPDRGIAQAVDLDLTEAVDAATVLIAAAEAASIDAPDIYATAYGDEGLVLVSRNRGGQVLLTVQGLAYRPVSVELSPLRAAVLAGMLLAAARRTGQTADPATRRVAARALRHLATVHADLGQLAPARTLRTVADHIAPAPARQAARALVTA